MTILEDVSYTRKDGQYLRWDHRSGRALRTRVNKGPILSFQHALGARLFEMVQDVDILKQEYGGGYPEFMTGSCLELLRELPDARFDMVITSPPYGSEVTLDTPAELRSYTMRAQVPGHGRGVRQMLARVPGNGDRVAELGP